MPGSANSGRNTRITTATAPSPTRRVAGVVASAVASEVRGVPVADARGEPDGAGGYRTEAVPVIMDWGQAADGSQGFMCRKNYPADALVQCQATGMACTLIHRSVYEKIRAKRRYEPALKATLGNAPVVMTFVTVILHLIVCKGIERIRN